MRPINNSKNKLNSKIIYNFHANLSMRLNIAYFVETKNNKKSFFGYCLLLKLLFTCLFAPFMSHEKCNRRWFKK